MNKNKLERIKIQLWCEGNTEKHYFESLLPNLELKNIRIDYINLKGKPYKRIDIDLQREVNFNKIMVVIDLDRADNKTELKYLVKLIQAIRNNKKSKDIFLFLTYKNFEDWLRFHFVDSAKDSRKNFYEKLGRTDENGFKANTKGLFSQITQHGGNIENAETYFKTRIEYLFYDNTREQVIDENNIDKIQSNLYCFRELLNKIDSSVKS